MQSNEASIAAEVRAVMGRKRIEVSEIARILGKSDSTASRKINGHIPFSVAELLALAGGLGESAAESAGILLGFFRNVTADSLMAEGLRYGNGGEAA